MTLVQPVVAEQPPRIPLPMPDPPPREPDEAMANFTHLAGTGSAHFLIQHFGRPDTTLVIGDRYLAPFPTRDLTGIRYPDLLIAFDVDPEAFRRSNAYIISEQGKPPDFVLEIASRSTGRVDVTDKRDTYAALGIPEYWRFDETGAFHGDKLAGDRLEQGTYRSIPIATLEEGVLQGYSRVLDMDLRWEAGQLKWHDPETGRHIDTFDDLKARLHQERVYSDRERDRADTERARAETERDRADTERARAETERDRADRERARAEAAEERIRALEAELRHRKS